MDDSVLREVIAAIEPLDEDAAGQAAARLGAPEVDAWLALAEQLAGVRRRVPPPVERMVLCTLAADRGPADPALRARTTATCQGTTPLAILCRATAAKLVVIDAGLVPPLEEPTILPLRVGNGAGLPPQAMSSEQVVVALQTGIALTLSLASEGLDVLGLEDLSATPQLGPGQTLESHGSFALGVMIGAILGAAAIRVPAVTRSVSAIAQAQALCPALGKTPILAAASVPETFLQIGVAARLLAELR